MIDYSQKPSQIELFPSDLTGPALIGKPRQALKDLTVSPENMIVWAIVLVMVFVLAFSSGVERGKKAPSVALTEEKINFEDKGQNAIIVPSATATDKVKAKDKSVVSKASSIVSEKNVKEEKASPKKDSKVLKVKESKELAQGSYTVQVASFKVKDRATQEAKQLEKIGHQIFVLSKGSYSIVCVGKFEQKEQADKLSKKLKGRYRDLVLRRL